MQDKVSKNAVELQEKLCKLASDKLLSSYIDNTMYHLVCSSSIHTGLEEIQMTYQILYELRNIFIEMEKNIS
jgi:hypothetical protein